MTDDESSDALIALDVALTQALTVASPEKVMRRIARSLSEIGPEALDEASRLALMDEFAAELEAVHGPLPEDVIQEAMREWPDYAEE